MKDQRTDSELNEIISKWLGWKFQPETPSGSPLDYEPEHWLDENGAPVNWFFCEDLNAIAEAVNKLTVNDWKNKRRYLNQLWELIPEGSDDFNFYWFPVEATARQRAEALVAVIEQFPKQNTP